MTRVGYPTLACFNNLPKVNRRVVALWARILRERPDARLLLVTKALGDARLAATWTSWFAAEGVDPSRIETDGRARRCCRRTGRASTSRSSRFRTPVD